MLALAHEMATLAPEPHRKFAPYLSGMLAVRFDAEVRRAAQKHLRDQVVMMLSHDKPQDDFGIGLIVKLLAANLVRG